jgi:hypothetical protein
MAVENQYKPISVMIAISVGGILNPTTVQFHEYCE